MKIMGYHTHWLADCWPILPKKELDALAEDIKTRGLKHPIILTRTGTEDLILDGRNRAMACEIAGVDPVFIHFQGDEEELLKEVLTQNQHTRKTTASQSAIAVAKMYQGLLRRGRPKQSTRRKAKNDAARQKKGPVGPFSNLAEIAKNHGIGERTLKRANAVLEHGTDALAEAVREGKVDLRATDRILKLDHEKQDRIVFGVEKTGLNATQTLRRMFPEESKKGGKKIRPKDPKDVVKPKDWKLSKPWADGFKKSWGHAEMVQGHLREAMKHFRRLENEMAKQAKKHMTVKGQYDFRQDMESLGSSLTTGLSRVDFMFIVDHCDCEQPEECKRCHGHKVVRMPFEYADKS